MTTIKDVAERARVSTATVSYVINKSRFVSDELTARVLKAVGDLKFTPSRLARNLRRGRTSIVGLITDDITKRFSSEFIGGLEEAAALESYSVIISDLHNDPGDEDRSIELLVDQKVEGLIYAGFGAAEARLLDLCSGGLPVVVADKPPVSEDLPSVIIDNRASVFEAMRHLLRLRHERITFINGLEINRNAQLRSKAFRDFLVRRGLPFSDRSIIYGDYTLTHGYQAALSLMDEKVPCSAIFCGDDVIAFGAMAALKSRGRRIPRDIAVVGFDDDPLARVMDPSLTTIHYPMREMGRVSFRLFQKLRTVRPKRPPRILLKTKLVVRRSTDPGYVQYRDLDGEMKRG